MRARRLAVAAALAAPLATLGPAAPASADATVTVEFVGQMRIGCLSSCESAAIDAGAVVAGTTGVTGAALDAEAYENTTPDLCTSFAQAWGTFSVDGITGDISWFRSHNQLAITVSNVNGGGITDGVGAGSATLLADPVTVTLASCGSIDQMWLAVAGSIAITG